jgi:hypothetical protein
MTTPADVQKARLLLGWSIADLSSCARVPARVIVEGEIGTSRWSAQTKHRLLVALEFGGIAFTLRGPELTNEGPRTRSAVRLRIGGHPRRGK